LILIKAPDNQVVDFPGRRIIAAIPDFYIAGFAPA